MQARMDNPAITLPGAIEALQGVGAAIAQAGIPESTLYLVELRASQINGCAVCVDIHSRELELAGEPAQRIHAVATWREAPYYSAEERAALALAEAGTRVADRPDSVSDEIWAEAAALYSEQQLAGLVLAIASINAWNRLNGMTRQISGEWVGKWVAASRAASTAA